MHIQYKQTSPEQKSEQSYPPRASVGTVFMFLHNSRQKPVRTEHRRVLHWERSLLCHFIVLPFCKCENAIQLAVAASIIICLAASGHGYKPRYLFFLCALWFLHSSLSPVVQPEPPSHLAPLKRSLLFMEHNRLLGQIISGLYCWLLRCTNWNLTSREQWIYFSVVETFISPSINAEACLLFISLKSSGDFCRPWHWKTSFLFPKVFVCT